jgi:putative ABC transport system permease protein
MSLIKNYLIIILRAFKRDLFYSVINLLGLTIGLTSAFLIFIYIQDELNYDTYFRDSDRIYRLECKFSIKGKEDLFAVSQMPLAPTLKDEYPEIEEYVRFMPAGTLYFKSKEEILQEDSILYTDSTIFNVFSHKFVSGDPSNALTEPNTIVISRSLATKYFGKTDVIGQSFETNDKQLFRITGVFEDLPWNVHYRYNGLISSTTIMIRIGEKRFNDRSSASFWNISITSFIKLNQKTPISSILDKSPEFYNKYMKEVGDKVSGNFVLLASPLSKIHYGEINLRYDNPKGNKSYLYILGFVGIFILLIACINYMNLATARSSRRSREIGIRKVSGAYKSLLIRQFLSESLLLALAAMVLAIGLLFIFLPIFNEFSSKFFTLSGILHSSISLVLVGITLLSGIISGLYPALYLSSFDPVKILKGISITDRGGAVFRRSLVVLQFTISVFMIICSLLVNGQLKYMRAKDLGFDMKNIVVITLRDSTIQNNLEAFKQELKNNPIILSAGASSSTPGSNLGIQVMKIEGSNGILEEKALNNFFVDYDYIEMMGFKLDTGRFYSKEMGSDIEKAFIINKVAADKFNWHENALKKRFQWGYNLDGTMQRDGEIIGVLKDFNYGSLHNPIDPVVLILSKNKDFLPVLSVRIKPGTKEKALEWINKVRNQFQPYYPFEYKFLDDKINEYYKKETAISKIFNVFTILTLFIAALGLFGLSSFLTQQKTKEIGLRKVLGSSSGQIVLMFLKDFFIWVLLANLIACPFAWFFMDKWLQDFYYKISIGPEYFIIAFIISQIVAILTVSWQSFKASATNPAESLKYE